MLIRNPTSQQGHQNSLYHEVANEGTVNLKEVALVFQSHATLDSRYRRLQRFFALFNIHYAQIAHWISKPYCTDDKKLYLAWCVRRGDLQTTLVPS